MTIWCDMYTQAWGGYPACIPSAPPPPPPPPPPVKLHQLIVETN